MSDDYSAKEIELIHESIQKDLRLILAQTTKHNGRLTKLERFVWTLSGSVAIFGMLEFSAIVQLFQ